MIFVSEACEVSAAVRTFRSRSHAFNCCPSCWHLGSWTRSYAAVSELWSCLAPEHRRASVARVPRSVGAVVRVVVSARAVVVELRVVRVRTVVWSHVGSVIRRVPADAIASAVRSVALILSMSRADRCREKGGDDDGAHGRFPGAEFAPRILHHAPGRSSSFRRQSERQISNLWLMRYAF